MHMFPSFLTVLPVAISLRKLQCKFAHGLLIYYNFAYGFLYEETKIDKRTSS